MSNAVLETLNKIRLLENSQAIFEDLSNLTIAEQNQLDALIKEVSPRAATEPEVKALIDRYSALKGGMPVTPEVRPEVRPENKPEDKSKPDPAKVKKFNDLLKKAGALAAQKEPEFEPPADNKPVDNPPQEEVNQVRVKGIGDILNKAIENKNGAGIVAALDPTSNGVKTVKEWYAIEEYYSKTYNKKLRAMIIKNTTRAEQIKINDSISNYKPRPNQIPRL
jgi:hypothetical protein